jgi:hypothetical protein
MGIMGVECQVPEISRRDTPPDLGSNAMEKSRRSLMCRLITIIVLGFPMLCMGFAEPMAQMETATDRFQPIQETKLSKLRSISKLAPLSEGDVRIRSSGFLEDASYVHIVRFETRMCIEDCLTAFFLDDIAEETLIGLAFLPPKLTRRDVSFDLCETCGRTWPVVFVYESGRARGVVVWNKLLIVGGQ